MDIQLIQDIALANVSDPTPEYFYRSVCRWYAKTFHTPLHLVEDLSPDHVLLNYFESMFETSDEDKIWEFQMRAIDPNFEENEEAAIEEFVEMVEQEEKAKALKLKEKSKNDPKLLKSKQSLDQGVLSSRTFSDETVPEGAGQGLDSLKPSHAKSGGRTSNED